MKNQIFWKDYFRIRQRLNGNLKQVVTESEWIFEAQ